MKKFIDHLGISHLNVTNIAMYETENGVVVQAENIVSGKVFGSKEFESAEQAQDWFDKLDGVNNASRLSTALEFLS